MSEILEKFLEYGLIPTILLVIVLLIVQDPSRAEKLKALITKPFYKAFKWFSKAHIANELSSKINSYLTSNVYRSLIFTDKTSVKIKWVKRIEDPYFGKNGNLILRIKEDEDQTKNVLMATQMALPQIICPSIRYNLDKYTSTSIDLVLMQKFAEKIGRHGNLIFKKFFLKPETENDTRIGELFEKLIKLDNHGVYTPIVLNELEIIGEQLHVDSDFQKYNDEFESFVNYLINIMERERGSVNELNYLVHPFKVGTILLAKSQIADSQGLRPYLRRLRIKISKGCESIYLISYPNSFNFFRRIINALESHESISIEKIINTIDFRRRIRTDSENFKIAILSTNRIFEPSTFKDRIESSNIKVGEIYSGVVDDISEKETLVNILGVRAYIKDKECSWNFVRHCNQYLSEGVEYDFKVLSIDFESGTIYLSRRIDIENPWNKVEKPNIGDIIEVEIGQVFKQKLIGSYNGLSVIIPFTQVAWFQPTENEIMDFIGNKVRIKVNEINNEDFFIEGSIRNVQENPWPNIHKSLPKGKEFTGRVIEINDYFVRVEVENSIRGIIPKEKMLEAGYEYRNFIENLKIGQGLQVYVSKVFINKKKIRFDLSRNKRN